MRHFAGGTDDVHWTIGTPPNAVGCCAFWMRTTQTTVNAILMSYWSSSSRNGWGLILNNTANKITANGYTTTTQRVNFAGTTTVNDGNPHHVAFNYDRNSGGTNTLYIDGVSVGSANSSGVWTDLSAGFWLECGDNADTFWPSYVGDIWEVGHWFGGQLTADEITALAEGYSPKLISPSKLILYAPMVRDVHDVRNGYTASATGGSVSDHARMVGGAI